MAEQKWLTTSAGIKMPPFLYGTAWKKKQTTELVVQAIQSGFRGIDTAGQPKHYDEPRVGEALAELNEFGIKREDLFVQTKFTPANGQDPSNMPYDSTASLADQVTQSFASSLRNLKTHYVDSLVLHSPLSTLQQTMEVWNTMETFHKSGEAKQLGISNCYSLSTLESIYSSADVKPAVLQNRFYQASGYDVDLRAWCVDKGITYQSFWTLTANPHLLASAPITSIAANYNRTPAQVFFRFLTQKGIAPLIGTTTHQHMKEDLAIFEFELSSKEIELIEELF